MARRLLTVALMTVQDGLCFLEHGRFVYGDQLCSMREPGQETTRPESHRRHSRIAS